MKQGAAFHPQQTVDAVARRLGRVVAVVVVSEGWVGGGGWRRMVDGS